MVQQLRFLILCQRKGTIPKGMLTKMPVSSPVSEYGGGLKIPHELKILRRNISELHCKKPGSDINIHMGQNYIYEELLGCQGTSLKTLKQSSEG